MDIATGVTRASRVLPMTMRENHVQNSGTPSVARVRPSSTTAKAMAMARTNTPTGWAPHLPMAGLMARKPTAKTMADAANSTANSSALS